MIQQHIYRKDKAGYRTVAASAGLTGSAWLSLLEQQTILRCQSDPPAPVYFQYPLGVGLVFSRCAVDPNGMHGSYLVHQLVANEPQDIEALASLRPLAADAFQEAYAGREGEIDPLPTLKPEALADSDLLSAGLKLIDGWFSEPLLARLLTALYHSARDKRQTVHIVIDGDPASVSAQGRLLLELLMRAMPLQHMQRLSWCTLIAPGETALPYSVCISPPCESKTPAGMQCVRFDLAKKICVWPGAEPEPDGECAELARALLAHDLNWADRVRPGGRAASLGSPEQLRLDVPPFENGMSLTQYIDDWMEAMGARRAALNDEAFRVFAADEWPRLIERVIRAADLMPGMSFVKQLRDSLVTLCRGRRGEALGMTQENLRDLIVVLLDSIRWDEVELIDPAVMQLIRSATGYASYLDGPACDQGCLLACRVVHTLLAEAMTKLSGLLDDLARLIDEYPAIAGQVQACARRYVTGRCRRAREGQDDEFELVDDMLVVTAMAGYVRFSGGIPDFRQMEKVLETVQQIGGAKAARNFEALMEKLRRRMHTTRTNHARRREMRLMLAGSLLLALVIIAVIAGYFLFIR